MKFIDIIRMVLRNLTKHKARTFLTVSGVVIGTCAIIVMISIGIGMTEAQSNIIDEWADLTLVEVYNYGGRYYGNSSEDSPPDITDDIIAEMAEIEHVKAVTPWYNELYGGEQVAVYSGEYSFNTNIVGVYMDQLENFGYELKEGRWKEEKDPVGTVILGTNFGQYGYNYVTEEYEWGYEDENGNKINYPMENPFDEDFGFIPLNIDMDTWTVDYSVIGSPSSPNYEYNMELNLVGRILGDYRNYETMQGIFIDVKELKNIVNAFVELNPDHYQQEFTGVYSYVKLRIDDMENVPKVEEAIKEMGYDTYSDGQSRENMMQQTRMIQMVLGALAAISLFVAALNITNTMIMAIVERTKEIGIMKVLGCDISKIRMLFLGEAAAIGFIGGIIGIALSYGISFILNTFLADAMIKLMGGGDGYNFPEGISISQIPIYLAFAALIFATIVGVIAGFQPANRSVKISALSAISHD